MSDDLSPNLDPDSRAEHRLHLVINKHLITLGTEMAVVNLSCERYWSNTLNPSFEIIQGESRVKKLPISIKIWRDQAVFDELKPTGRVGYLEYHDSVHDDLYSFPASIAGHVYLGEKLFHTIFSLMLNPCLPEPFLLLDVKGPGMRLDYIAQLSWDIAESQRLIICDVFYGSDQVQPAPDKQRTDTSHASIEERLQKIETRLTSIQDEIQKGLKLRFFS